MPHHTRERRAAAPSMAASTGGFLHPGPDTAREGAAGLLLLAGLGLLAVGVAAAALARVLEEREAAR